MNNQQRSCELEILAHENGWDFSLNVTAPAFLTLQKFEFHTGEKRKAQKIENLIKGAGFQVFDVFWQDGFDPSDALAAVYHRDMSARNTRQQTMFFVESTDLHLLKFHVYPAESLSLMDRWLDKAFRRISFSAYPEFEKRYSVRSTNEKVVNYFNENISGLFEKNEEFWTFANDSNIFIYQPNILTSPSQILHWIKIILELAALFGGKNNESKNY